VRSILAAGCAAFLCAPVSHSETLTHAATPHALGCIPSDAEKSYIYQVLNQLNDYRLANGLNALRYDLALERSVEGHCHHMSQHGFFAHTHTFANEPESQSPSLRSQANGAGSAGGENIASGYGTPTAVMTAWKASPGHNANMLGSYARVGIGYFTTGSLWASSSATAAPPSPTRPRPPSPRPPPRARARPPARRRL